MTTGVSQMPFRVRFLRTTCAVVATLLLTSCNQEPTERPSPDPQPQVGNRTSSRWIENPSVDLMSSEGTFIRAVVESLHAADVSLARKRDALAEGGFPGFARAFNNPGLADEYFSINNQGWSYAGTSYYEVVEYSRTGDIRKAGVCNYKSMTAAKRPGSNEYETSATPSTGFGSIFTFSPDPRLTPDQQISPPPHQRGPADRPSEDVFGTWIVIDMTSLVGGRLPCAKPAPGTPSDRPDPYIWPEPPPALSPQPGWPESATA